MAGGSQTGAPSSGSPLLIVNYRGTAAKCGLTNNPSGDVMSVDELGNMKLCGTLTITTTPLVVTRTTAGVNLVSYAARKSQPTIEDDGQGQLVNGQTYVPIDRSFAITMDPRANYLVFITPEGDNRGLYVTRKSLAGFIVRESQGGRSNLVFNYRIVAKPVDSDARRLSPMPAAFTVYHPFISRKFRHVPHGARPHVGFIPKPPPLPAILQKAHLTGH